MIHTRSYHRSHQLFQEHELFYAGIRSAGDETRAMKVDQEEGKNKESAECQKWREKCAKRLGFRRTFTFRALSWFVRAGWAPSAQHTLVALSLSSSPLNPTTNPTTIHVGTHQGRLLHDSLGGEGLW